ncbi:MAG TPA: hypothetical protein VFA87_11200 [Rhizomicrobium sp.]|nr:hypothetical protein [Rhizomicrobium sp.]
MPSFLYPRTIKITRPGAQTGVGFNPAYAAEQQAEETKIACNIPASIQARSSGGRNPVGLPGDSAMNMWRVLTPLGALADGQVKNRDLIYDDLGRKFQVSADYTNSLGADFIVERLEA